MIKSKTNSLLKVKRIKNHGKKVIVSISSSMHSQSKMNKYLRRAIQIQYIDLVVMRWMFSSTGMIRVTKECLKDISISPMGRLLILIKKNISALVMMAMKKHFLETESSKWALVNMPPLVIRSLPIMMTVAMHSWDKSWNTTI